MAGNDELEPGLSMRLQSFLHIDDGVGELPGFAAAAGFKLVRTAFEGTLVLSAFAQQALVDLRGQLLVVSIDVQSEKASRIENWSSSV